MTEPRRIVAFDVETTGKNPAADQIIELSIWQVDEAEMATLEEGRGDAYVQRFRPEVEVSPGARAVHGISNQDLIGEPSFAECAEVVAGILADAQVLIGYNVAFDIRFLEAEFARVGQALDLSEKLVVDPLRIWHSQEPRRLENAYGRFVGGTLDDAHSAEADTRAVVQVLAGMKSAFSLEASTWEELADMTAPDRRSWIGTTHHLKWEAGEIVFGFGKYDGRPLFDIAQTDPNYLEWIRDKDFPRHVQSLCKGAASGISRERFVERVREFYGEPEVAPQ